MDLSSRLIQKVRNFKLKLKQLRCKHIAKVFDEPITVKEARAGKEALAHCQRCLKHLGKIGAN